MKVLSLKSGDKVKMDGFKNSVIFIGREPRICSTPAANIFQCEAWIGQNGQGDKGYFPLTDFQVRKLCSLIEHKEKEGIIFSSAAANRFQVMLTRKYFRVDSRR